MSGSEHRAQAGRRRGRLVAWLRRARRGSARAGLATLDERLLRDIGLTRNEAEELSR